MKNIGLLVTKNEERIIEEVLSKNERFVDVIYALDASSDRTPGMIKKFRKLKLMLYEKDLGVRFVDGIRQFLLEEIRRREGYGHWITLLMGDEIFYHSPRKVIQAAEKEGADGIRWYAMHFFLHTSDKTRWNEIKSLPMEQRVTHYAINEKPWSEFRQFKFHEGVKYDIHVNHPRPEGIRKIFSKRPIYKHYKVYCREMFRIYATRPNTGLPFIPKNPEEEIFMEKLAGRFPWGDYKYTIKFNGNFGKFERGLECLK